MMPLRPAKIIGIGRNYVEHARELGNEVPDVPIIFFKPPTALIGPGDTIVLPDVSQRVEFEAEIGVVIGKRIRTRQSAPLVDSPASTMSPAAIFRKSMGSGGGPRDSTPFVRLGPAWSAGWIGVGLSFSAGSMGRSASGPRPPTCISRSRSWCRSSAGS